jgi:hypothetical protein
MRDVVSNGGQGEGYWLCIYESSRANSNGDGESLSMVLFQVSHVFVRLAEDQQVK